jgi:hypothetical protein
VSNVKPYMTTDDLIESIKRRISFPLSQNTFTYNDIVALLNEELQLNAVPSVKELHEEYFVFDVAVPVVNGINKYSIPDRAIGMALRDICYSDVSGNFHAMTRLSPEDKAFFQGDSGSSGGYGQFYLRGNEVVLSQNVTSGASGNLIMSIFLRPNFLVRDDRAATIIAFQKPVVVTDVNNVGAGDTITISVGNQTQTPLSYVLTAVAGTPSANEFEIGTTEATTASNIASAINDLQIDGVTASAVATVCTLSFEDISSTFSTSSAGMTIDNDNVYIQFDGLNGSYTDPDTDETSTLYASGVKVDFLQTNPGHRTYAYDIKLRQVLSGGVGKFKAADLQTYLSNSNGGQTQTCPIKVGDYMCLANECVIPQIPPELHSALAERGAARILSAIGDKDGYAISQAKIAEMDKQQAALIGSRVEGTVRKVFNKNSLLRVGSRRRRI